MKAFKIALLFAVAFVTSAFAKAQLVENTTPGLFEQFHYSWASDGRQFVLNDIGIYEATLNIVFLPRLSAGHGFVWGKETLKQEVSTEVDVWGWELYGRLPIGGDGAFVKAAWGPLVDDRMRMTFPGRIEAGWRF